MKFDIKMYADFQCPFCYIGKCIFNNVKDDYDIDFTFKGFEIHGDVPQKGISIDDYFGSTHDMNKQIKDYGQKYGIDIANLTTVVNSNKSLRIAEYAKEVGKGDEYNEAMYKAMFVDTLNIGLDDILKEICSNVGISSDEVDKVLLEPKYKNTLLDNHYYCKQNEINSVPTFIINDKVRITGAQPPEVFKEVFEKFEKGEF
jgi:predicted DsbA family dithiol-disulfide isomerase